MNSNKLNVKRSAFWVIFLTLALLAFVYFGLQPVELDHGKPTRLNKLQTNNFNILLISEFKGPRWATIGNATPGKYIVAGDCGGLNPGAKVGLTFLGGTTEYKKPFALYEITNGYLTHFEFEVEVKSFKPTPVKFDNSSDFYFTAYDVFSTEGFLVASIIAVGKDTNSIGRPMIFVEDRVSLSPELHIVDAVVINPK